MQPHQQQSIAKAFYKSVKSDKKRNSDTTYLTISGQSHRVMASAGDVDNLTSAEIDRDESRSRALICATISQLAIAVVTPTEDITIYNKCHIGAIILPHTAAINVSTNNSIIIWSSVINVR